MKKGRFLWSAHRITEKQKAGKARNIKEKRQLKNFSTASKPPVALRSSPSANLLKIPETQGLIVIRYYLALRGAENGVTAMVTPFFCVQG